MVTDPHALRPRLEALTWIPFASYATNTELYLITNVLRRVAMYGAFAALCVWMLHHSALSHSARLVAVTALAAGLATLVEAMQVMLPRQVVDSGDVLIAGCVGTATVLLWPQSLVAARRSTTVGAERVIHVGSRQGAGVTVPLIRLSRLAISAVVAVFAAALTLAYVLPVPYNLRELLVPGGDPWPAFTVSVAALALFGAPAWLARTAVPACRVPVLRTVAGLFLLPIAIAAVLYIGVPRESVHDIVGSPILGTADALETIMRLAVLIQGAVWALTLGHALQGITLEPHVRRGTASHLLLHGVWVVPCWHLMVVSWAGSDNLTELMHSGGGLQATACLLAYGVLVGARPAAP